MPNGHCSDEPTRRLVRKRTKCTRRKFKRERRFLRGRIHFNDSRNAVDCLIQDISCEGARIVLSDSADVPDEVQLYIPDRKRLVLARVRWRRADRAVCMSQR
jgi:PilZ domain